jgi:hypothetical protein
MIRDTYLDCKGQFMTDNDVRLDDVVDFNNPAVREQLSEAFLSGKNEGELNINGQSIKWNLDDLEMTDVKNVSMGIGNYIELNQLSNNGREQVLDFLLKNEDRFIINADDLLNPEIYLADKDNFITELEKIDRFDDAEKFFEDLPAAIKENKDIMLEAVEMWPATFQLMIDDLKYDDNFFDRAISVSDGEAYQYAPDDIKNMSNSFDALLQDTANAEYIPEKTLLLEEFISNLRDEGLDQDYDVKSRYRDLDIDLDPETITVMSDWGTYYKQEDYYTKGKDYLSADRVPGGSLEDIVDNFLNGEFELNSSFMAMITDAYGDYSGFPFELQDNEKIASAMIANAIDKEEIECIVEDIPNFEKEFVREAIEKNSNIDDVEKKELFNEYELDDKSNKSRGIDR